MLLEEKELRGFAKGAALPSAQQQPGLLLSLKRKSLPLPRKTIVRMSPRHMAKLKARRAVLTVRACGSGGLLLFAGAVGAVAAANMFFFRHNQNPVAAGCQRKAGFTLENNAVR